MPSTLLLLFDSRGLEDFFDRVAAEVIMTNADGERP